MAYSISLTFACSAFSLVRNIGFTMRARVYVRRPVSMLLASNINDIGSEQMSDRSWNINLHSFRRLIFTHSSPNTV